MNRFLRIFLRSGFTHWLRGPLSLALLLALFSSFQVQQVRADSPVPTVTVFASGLDNPRGLKFGPDGYLYVAEGGRGGTNSTVGQCEQVPFPIGPDSGGKTARISKFDNMGVRTTVADGFPSFYINPLIGPDTMGVADVAFIKDELFGVVAGGGCSHGNPDVPNGVFEVMPDGQWSLIADLSAFWKANPVAQPEADDFEPDGTPYSMIQADSSLYIVEANHGEIDRVKTNGSIRRVVDLSASQGHIVPTAIAYHEGFFYVGNLTPYPIQQGEAKILKINRDGEVSTFATGLTNVVGLQFGPDDAMYVLESNVGVPFPAPGNGELVRIDESGKQEVVLSGLALPTAMTFGPSGELYIANWGYGYHDDALGEILRVTLNQ